MDTSYWSTSRSEAVRYSLDLCDLYARVRRPVVLVGPVGAGKTTLAKRLHQRSGRPGRFVPVSAGELSDTLFEDALFGHTAGAYTGARGVREGAFREANGGTLLLDDLALMSSRVQAAILRVLESGRFRPLGAKRDEVADCRILFATTVSPEGLARSGHLLPDVASRIGELVVSVPPLASRVPDIPTIASRLACDFLREHGSTGRVSFTSWAMNALCEYAWPGNVRELKGVVERGVIHAGMKRHHVLVDVVHLPDKVRECRRRERGGDLTLGLVEAAVRRAGGNKSEAARQPRSGYVRSVSARSPVAWPERRLRLWRRASPTREEVSSVALRLAPQLRSGQ